MDSKFKNKVAVVTGGALGIGRCLAQEFAKKCARIAFIDKNKDAGEENLKIIKNGRRCHFFLW